MQASRAWQGATPRTLLAMELHDPRQLTWSCLGWATGTGCRQDPGKLPVTCTRMCEQHGDARKCRASAHWLAAVAEWLCHRDRTGADTWQGEARVWVCGELTRRSPSGWKVRQVMEDLGRCPQQMMLSRGLCTSASSRSLQHQVRVRTLWLTCRNRLQRLRVWAPLLECLCDAIQILSKSRCRRRVWKHTASRSSMHAKRER